MHPCVAYQAFKTLGGVDQFLGLRFVLVGRSQRGRVFQRLVDGDVEGGGNHLPNAIHLGVGNVHGAPGIFDRRLGRHGPEGDDLRHVVASILLGDVVDHLAAAVHAEVNIDVRQADALRIEEALEQQLILQWINVGDAESVGHHRTCCRSAARPDWDVALFGVADEVPDDEKVAGELHLPDHADLARQALLVLFQRMFQPPCGLEFPQNIEPMGKALPGDVLKVVRQRVTGRHLKLGKRIVNFFQPNVAAFRDLQGPRRHVLISQENLLHLDGALHGKLVATEFQAVGVVDGFTHLNAEHHVLRMGVILAEIVAVIGRDQRDVEFLLQLQQVRLDARFLRQSLVLNFEIEISFAKNVAKRNRGFASCVVLPFREVLGDFALKTRRQTNQPPGVLGQEFLADPGSVVEAVQRCFGDNLDQIAIAFVILSQHDEVVVAVAFLVGAMVLFLADVKLAAQNRLHARLFGVVEEFHSAEDVAMVGHGDIFGAVKFFNDAKEAGVKPILGCELYICKKEDHRTDKEGDSYNHLVVLAENDEGYRNLVKIVSEASLHGFYYRPRVSKKFLAE